MPSTTPSSVSPAFASLLASVKRELGGIRRSRYRQGPPRAVWVSTIVSGCGAGDAAILDANRKPADTAEWVARLAPSVGVHALAVIDTILARDPDDVRRLGSPIG